MDYRTQDGQFVPAVWSATGYTPLPGKLFEKDTFTVEQIEINGSLPASLFEKPLEPGMVVFDVEGNKALQVSSSGRLAPLGSALETGMVTRVLFWTTVGLLVIAAAVLVWRYVCKLRTAR